MWLNPQDTIGKHDLVLRNPLVNASGMLGFAPDLRRAPLIAHLGAFITNPISLAPRQPAANRACLPYEGGFLLHTGLPNPGLKQVVRRYQPHWAAADLPVIVHLLVDSPASLTGMVRLLEGLENILAIELGLPPMCTPDDLQSIMAAGAGELPLIPCLSPEEVGLLGECLKQLQPAAVHLVEPRGSLPNALGETVTGRLYGPATFPVMLRAVSHLVTAGLRVIANGGISARWQIDSLLGAGVMAVGLSSILWGLDRESLFSTSPA